MEAGPGWGKTTAVRAAFPDAQYVEAPSGGRPGSFHVAVLGAFGLAPADAGSIAARLASDADGVVQSVLTAVPAASRLIVDDVQRLDPAGTQLLEALAEAQDVHLVLVGRSMAGLPVGSWMSRGLIGMPFGPDTLALRTEHVSELFSGLGHAPALVAAIVSNFGGWPIAASLAASLLRRGYAPKRVLGQLAEGISTIAGSALAELSGSERTLLLEAALASAHGIRPTSEHFALVRRLGFPESATGLHEIIVAALLKAVDAAERTTVAERMALEQADPSAVFALLSSEAPHALAGRSWDLLASLYDNYDRSALERMAAHREVPRTAAAAARSFLLVFASQFEEAAAIAEPILPEVARHSPAVALRLSRSMAYGGRGAAAVPVLLTIESDEPSIAVYRECLLGNLLGEKTRLTAAMQVATRSGSPSLVATAAIHAALVAVRGSALDEAEGLAARGEDAARAAASVLLQARALKIRYGIAVLRGNLDLAAVHVGRLVSMQALVGDPNERASDLVAAFEIEVLSGRAGRAAAYDDALRKIGHDWLGMETYAVCRAIVDAWDGELLSAADRVAAFASAAPPHMQRLPLGLGSFCACAAGNTDRGAELLRNLAGTPSASSDPFTSAHFEMAASFAAMAEVLLGRAHAASSRLQAEARTAIGDVFVAAARRFVAHRDIAAYAETMRTAGLGGIAMMADACGLDRERTPLSRTELSVLSYLASGMDAPRIANLTGRSLHTIKNQRRSIIGKLGAGNTIEAVAIARRLGLL
ncbi:MAG: LuxR C-terminal-related transcriptional regulator [Candidatus Tumulicola sp.]